MKRFNILLLEDDLMYFRLIPSVLKKLPYNLEFSCFNNGLSAYIHADKAVPDLIITDWDMPDMNGIDFCRKVKNNPALHDTPIVMCTGVNTAKDNLKAAYEAGVSDFVTKPFDKSELLSRVNSMLILSDSIRTVKQQQTELQAEKQRSENLLMNLLPEKIALELKDGGKTEPELFNNVSVFIADIVCFTGISSSLDLHTLFSELNELFTAFDTIMKKNNCERIKTVGDGYYAVCGMHVPDPRHAKNIVSAGVEIMDFLNERNNSHPVRWKIRVGIHTGSVIGGVVGSTKYVYDIFGKTINIASRLEKSSKPMRIQVSETVYEMVKTNFRFDPKSSVRIKGAGKINTYLVAE
ncbi:MAG: adenylate/guanylate cyclase domain-containing protein [Bacteroidota bacterium]